MELDPHLELADSQREGRDEEPDRVCPFCEGSGQCERCGGTGERVAARSWVRGRRVQSCNACDGSGRCGLCRGAGRLPGDRGPG